MVRLMSGVRPGGFCLSEHGTDKEPGTVRRGDRLVTTCRASYSEFSARAESRSLLAEPVTTGSASDATLVVCLESTPS